MIDRTTPFALPVLESSLQGFLGGANRFRSLNENGRIEMNGSCLLESEKTLMESDVVTV